MCYHIFKVLIPCKVLTIMVYLLKSDVVSYISVINYLCSVTFVKNQRINAWLYSVNELDHDFFHVANVS